MQRSTDETIYLTLSFIGAALIPFLPWIVGAFM